MSKLSGEFREPNRKDKVTRFPSVSYARQLGLLVNTPGSHLKVFRPSIFAGTPSIFECLILKQIDLYGKTIITYGLHLDETLFWGTVFGRSE